jgi:hypothetical protein
VRIPIQQFMPASANSGSISPVLKEHDPLHEEADRVRYRLGEGT